MSYTDFRDAVWKHLREYKENNLKIPDNVVIREKEYYHILPDNLKEKNYLEGVDIPPKGMKLHIYSHHLNSSQTMCYNFFRPYIESIDKNGKGNPSKHLYCLLNKIGLNIEFDKNSECCFEYIQDGWGKNRTNFDFYISKGDTEIFFEIKYTEPNCGKYSGETSLTNLYNDCYKEKIDSCEALKKKQITINDLNYYYQLICNVIRVQNKDKYVVFIIDQNNTTTYKQFQQFISTFICDKWKTNILLISWQDIVSKAKEIDPNNKTIDEFIEKYLNYKYNQ